MRALLVPVNGKCREIDVDGLSGLQKAVGGALEGVGWLFGDEPVICVNADGKASLAPNRAVYATEKEAGHRTWDGKAVEEGDALDILFGDFVAIGFDPATGAWRDITDEEIERVKERFDSEESVSSTSASMAETEKETRR